MVKLSILICLSLILKILFWTLETKTQVLLIKTNIYSKFNDFTIGIGSVNNKFYFPSLYVSKAIGTVDFDAHVNREIFFSFSFVCKSLTNQELDTLHHVSEQERTQWLTVSALCVQKPQLAGYLLTGNRSNFFYVEGSTASLYDCPQFFSTFFEAAKYFDRLPVYHQDTVMYIAPITRRTFNYVTPISCYNNPQNDIALDLDNGKQSVPPLKSLLRATPTLFEPKWVESKKSPNTFTAQEAGIFPIAEWRNSWNRVFFTKQSDIILRFS